MYDGQKTGTIFCCQCGDLLSEYSQNIFVSTFRHNNYEFSPCIMCVQCCGGYHEYHEGHLEYPGGCSVLQGLS